MLDASGTRQLLLAETLGLAMARRAAEILERHRAAPPDAGRAHGAGPVVGGPVVGGPVVGGPVVGGPVVAGPVVAGPAVGGTAGGDEQFALDNAVFAAVLDAANECLGRFDPRPADGRWCDALLQVLNLGQLASLTMPPSRGTTLRIPRAGPARDRPPRPGTERGLRRETRVRSG
jgi:hypothetical protein